MIEVLVVLVIIGIMIGFAQLNAIPGEQETLRAEVNRFALLVEQAANEARSSGYTHACLVGSVGYVFMVKKDDAWIPTTDEILRPREWPEGMTIKKMEIDGQKALEGQKILLSSSGYSSIFSIELALGEFKMTVSGTTIGRVSVQ